MASHEEVLDLIQHLKQERLFVTAERRSLQRLNEQVTEAAERLAHSSWIGRRQYLNLQHFMSGQEDPHACQSLNTIDKVSFIDAYKVLNYHESKFVDFLRMLIENPKLLSQCLIVGDGQRVQLNGVIQTILSSLYGNCIMQTDERLVLKLLRDLIENQIAVNDNPLRLLRKGSCAFSKFYKLFCEGLFPAKLFLTAALHKPIMRLLMEDDWFFDVDPEKALVRFPPNERLTHFGQPGSKDYEANLQRYRSMTINKLVQFAERFIQSIKRSMCCFPQSLSWIVQTLYSSVTRAGKVDKDEAKAICAQLVFTFFICPAVCDPEQYGITSDVCISYIARHNLMQVAQILQVLAVARTDEIDPKQRDLFSRFDKDCMSCLLDAMLSGGSGDSGPPRPHLQLQSVSRTAVLTTITDLRELVLFLQACVPDLAENSSERKLLDSLLSSLPMSVLRPHTPAGSPNHSPPGTPQSATRKKGPRLKTPSSGNSLTADESDDVTSPETETTTEDVIVIPIRESSGFPGMLPETKVLEQNKEEEIQNNGIQDGVENGELPVPGHVVLVGGEEVIEKRTRFSLSHDQDSIGNTSDNVDPSEACSSHSVGSEEQDQDPENDNLSDMLSANVSGRGSPSISGRDTPLSQNEVEELEPEPPRRQMALSRGPDLPVTALKPSRVDVTERFGKFELRNDIERDEAKSTVSDTWSTDVLASDSEPPERDQLDRLEEVAEEMLHRPGLLGVSFAEVQRNRGTAEPSETASDAWSTDVLASDTDEKQSERLLELDQDDQLSVSSKSQCTEDGRDAEFGEDTPQASGVQSPADTSVELGAVGGLPSIFDPSSRGDTRDPRDPSSRDPRDPGKKRHKNQRPDRFSEPVDSRRAQNFDLTDFDRNTFQGFEDGILQRSANKAQRRRTQNAESKRVVIANQSPDGGEHNSYLGLPEPSSSSSSSNTSSHHRPERDSGISETPQEDTREEGASLGGLSERLSKVNFKERTPDREELAMFDPLMVGSDSEEDRKSNGLNDSLNSTEGRLEASGGQVEKHDDAKSESRKRSSTTSIFRAFKDRWSRGGRKTGGKDDDWSPEKGGVPEGKLVQVDKNSNVDDRGEDILSKYRRKTRESSSPDRQAPLHQPSLDIPQYDPENVENCQAFHNAKRKLRLVFSSADFQTLPWSFSHSKRLSEMAWGEEEKGQSKENDLVALLRMQLAEAINLQDKDLVAQLHETIRCVKIFDEKGTKKLVASLKTDYKSRSPYISYLVQCRQGLLASLAHLERLLQRVDKDKEVCNKYLVSMCVRRLLEKREGAIINLVPEFTRLTAADEKTDLLENFLEKLYRRMTSDAMWRGATDRQIEEGRLAVERSIMSRLYFHAMFPNGDGDTHRDKILSQHIASLAETITPSHPSLCIPKIYHSEAPWPSAQAEIFLINAYKTPKDKVTCIMNTSAIINNLLSMASDSAPAADDFIPVLIYVLIQANPRNLLSSVQYISSLYDKRFSGEEHYWWTQFVAAIEFIKTM